MADTGAPSDWYRLRWHLALLLLAMIVGAGVALIGVGRLQSAAAAHQRAVAQQMEVRNKLARVREEEIDLAQQVDVYRMLKQRGILGEEYRLDWTELMLRTVERRKLFEVQYELAPRAPGDVIVGGTSGAGFEVLSSRMKFEMPLLHENDLLNLLADLQLSARAVLALRACSIERAPAAENTDGPAPRLKAACALDWITIREKK